MGQKRPVEHEYDCDTARDHDQQGYRKLSPKRDFDIRISLQEPATQGARGQAGEHREPAVSDRPRPFVYEQDEAAHAGQQRPAPGHQQCDGCDDSFHNRGDVRLQEPHSGNVRLWRGPHY